MSFLISQCIFLFFWLMLILGSSNHHIQNRRRFRRVPIEGSARNEQFNQNILYVDSDLGSSSHNESISETQSQSSSQKSSKDALKQKHDEILHKKLEQVDNYYLVWIAEDVEYYLPKLEKLIREKRLKMKVEEDYDFIPEILDLVCKGFDYDIQKIVSFICYTNFLTNGFENYNREGIELPDNILSRAATSFVFSRKKLTEAIKLWDDNYTQFYSIWLGYHTILNIAKKFFIKNQSHSESFLFAFKYDILKSLKKILQ